MNIVTGIMVYVILWWVVVFTVLPVGVRTEENPKMGMAWGHPKKVRLAKAFFWTTLITTVLWIGIYLAVENIDFSFRWDPKDEAFYAK